MPETLDADIVRIFANEFFNAVSEGISGNEILFTDDPGRDFIENITGNVWRFSGAKNYAQQKAISEQLVDATGKLRSFKDFKFAASQINDEFVGTWLKAEYNNAVASAQMGAKWLQIQRDKTILPYLQYITAGDERVRLEHQELDDITLPVDHQFWDTYYPPNGWNCRCDVKQISYIKTPSDLSKYSLPDVPKLFQGNVGKTGNAFPPAHPYFENLPPKVSVQVKAIQKDFENKLNESK
jgi:SPP1 gp7 family putative phage head morphogenesis protein